MQGTETIHARRPGEPEFALRRGAQRVLIGAAVSLLIAAIAYLLALELQRLSAEADHTRRQVAALQLRTDIYSLAGELAVFRGARFLPEESDPSLDPVRAGLRARVDAVAEGLAHFPITAREFELWRSSFEKTIRSPEFIPYTVTLSELLRTANLFSAEARIGAFFVDDEQQLLDLSPSLVAIESKLALMRGLQLLTTEVSTGILNSVAWDARRALHFLSARLETMANVDADLQALYAAMSVPAEKVMNELAPGPKREPEAWFEFASVAVSAATNFRSAVDERLASMLQADIDEVASRQRLTVLFAIVGVVFLLGALTLYRRAQKYRFALLDALHESEHRYRTAVDGAGVGLIDYKDEMYWSDGVYELLRLPPETGPAQILDLVHPDHQAEAIRIRDRLQSGPTTAQMQAPLLCGDDTYRWFSINAASARVEGRSALRLSGALIDIEDIKELEALRRSETELSATVHKLEEVNSDLERFAHMASHDLQEPLRMVTAFTGLLDEDYGDSLDERAQRYITFARDGAEGMQGLIDDLLQYARAGAGELQFEQTSLEPLVAELRMTMQNQLSEADAVVNLAGDAQLVADAVGLRCILSNLISNSVKYRRSTVPLVIDIAVEHEASHWVLRVTDNGIGIPADQISQVFVPFQRLHARADIPGTGVGLSLCRRIVDRWGGSIGIESRENEFTTVSIVVPVALALSEAA